MSELPPPHLEPHLYGFPEHHEWWLFGALRIARELIDVHGVEPPIPATLAWYFAKRGWLRVEHWKGENIPSPPFRLTRKAREELNAFEEKLGIGRRGELTLRPLRREQRIRDVDDGEDWIAS